MLLPIILVIFLSRLVMIFLAMAFQFFMTRRDPQLPTGGEFVNVNGDLL
jgi:hypothetical protein